MCVEMEEDHHCCEKDDCSGGGCDKHHSDGEHHEEDHDERYECVVCDRTYVNILFRRRSNRNVTMFQQDAAKK